MSFPPSHPALDRALAARGYAEPTPVQRAVLEADQNPDRPGADLLVSAQTGSGKTVAFGLALASTLLGDAQTFGPAGKPAALIIAPTRELAMQISREFEWLYAETGARIVSCVGGMSVRHEQVQLNAGAHIVIGTPGRLCDHLSRGYLDLAELKVAVLDEADEMLDLGFREELETLLDATNAETRRTLLFSATIARGIAQLARSYQRDAVRIDTTSQTEPHGDIDYRAMRILPGDTERAVVNVLRYFEAGGALVFCATREAVRHLHASLRERGFHAVGLSGEMGQRERNDALQSLRDGHARVCVATDVAARGLDLPDLGLVIHADLPTNKATLLHRSGRTGRAGRKGVSVLLVTHTKRRRTEGVLQSANIIATWSGPPTAAEIRERDRQRLLDHPTLGAQLPEDDLAIAREIASRHTPEQLAGALVGLLRADLPEPEDVNDDSRMRETRTTPLDRAPRERPVRSFDDAAGDGSWFRLNVGRQRNADPKWLIPLICRLGHITKAEIGPIRIFDDETKFEIVGHASEAFGIAVEATLADNIQITPSSAPQRGEHGAPRSARPPRDDRPRAERPAREERPHRDRPAADRPRPDRAREDRPREDRPRPARAFDRDTARPPKREHRPAAPSHIDGDPVLAGLVAAERAPRQHRDRDSAPKPPSASTPASLNRRERRDAARAEGKLPGSPPARSQGQEPPKRTWTPDQADAAIVQAAAPTPRPPRAERDAPPRRERPASSRPSTFKPRGDRSQGDRPQGDRPRSDGPRGEGGKTFKPRGPKPRSERASTGGPAFTESTSERAAAGKPFKVDPARGKPFPSRGGADRTGRAGDRTRPPGKPHRKSQGGKPKGDWRG